MVLPPVYKCQSGVEVNVKINLGGENKENKRKGALHRNKGEKCCF